MTAPAITPAAQDAAIDPTDPVAMTAALVRCPSVTPAEAGALDLLEAWLRPLGFACHRQVFQAPGTAAVDNLFAVLGDPAGTGHHLAFAGHTDVVPPGDPARWTVPPFSGRVEGGFVHGRGAADMKGGIACWIAATARHLARHRLPAGAAISLIITGDEEAEAINGTGPLMDWIAAHGWTPDACIVGEPTNPTEMGQMMKVGRRGSLSAELTVTGIQGHSAYPDRADNPCDRLVRILAELIATPLDQGTDAFPPSTLAITSIDVGNPARNVIPAVARAAVNIRFNDAHSGDSLTAHLTQICRRHAADRASVKVSGLSEVFLTPPGPLSTLVADAAAEVLGRRPEASTTGGTSDARFVRRHCPVVEFGAVGATIHQIDERAAIADLASLTDVYRVVLERSFATGA